VAATEGVDVPRWGWGVIAGLAAVVLVLGTVLAVGSGDDSTDSTTTTTSSSTTTTVPNTSTSTPPPPVTTTTKPDITCQVSQLAANLGQPDAGAGQRYSKLVFTNNSNKDCTMFGFPGLQLVGMGNVTIPTNVVRNDNKPKVLVTLQAGGGQAYTTLHWGVMPGPGEPQNGPCEPEPQQVQLTSPNAFGSLTQPWTFGPVCEQGTIDVDPMAPGTGN
jgi:hypothetical protein